MKHAVIYEAFERLRLMDDGRKIEIETMVYKSEAAKMQKRKVLNKSFDNTYI